MDNEPKVCGLKYEVYSRVVGYLRPVQGWNKGKKEEFKRRVVFDTGKALEQSGCSVEDTQETRADADINALIDKRFEGTPGY